MRLLEVNMGGLASSHRGPKSSALDPANLILSISYIPEPYGFPNADVTGLIYPGAHFSRNHLTMHTHIDELRCSRFCSIWGSCRVDTRVLLTDLLQWHSDPMMEEE
ncbi:hypothetical protein PTI98_010480 [Pleurotus ostreatus]|nr:hypothetical protein PTI98_010480 [Pleurotus ostreatus]